ncbi:hypothetical protein HED60_04020 [Planctomycetales bacterium ZRK34]|nr:hypothetical protein HED60_04020 [Planctomycetales bacterium ZRK34]
MNDPAATHEVLIWTDAERGDLIEQVVGRMRGIHILAVGGPRKGPLAPLAATLDARCEDDLRKMLVDQPASFLLLGTTTGVSKAELEQAQRSGTTVLALEPVAADLDVLGDEALVRTVVMMPALYASPAWQAAAEPQQALGTIQSIHLSSLAPPAAGSLYTRFYESLDLLMTLMPSPETIDAALTGPLKQVPDDLRSLTGHLTAHLRFAGGASAVMHLSDRADAWSRRLVIIGDEGQITLDDISYRLSAADGHTLDELAPPDKPVAIDPADLIVAQWQKLMDRAPSPRTAPPHQIIAAARSALLSCRTGELESVATLLRMRRGAAV